MLQLPFKKAKYDVDINEPGLGEIYGQRLTLRAEVSHTSEMQLCQGQIMCIFKHPASFENAACATGKSWWTQLLAVPTARSHKC